ncbi:MAG: peptidoglycan editing factor PgeF [Candidatus Sulfotelmatobacter sp.]
MATRARIRDPLSTISASKFGDFRWLIHGFSTRVGGFSRAYGGPALNLGFTKDDSKTAVERNRGLFLAAIGAAKLDRSTGPSKSPHGLSLALSNLVTLKQIHSDIIHMVDRIPESTLVGDGLITDAPGLVLGIQTADCLPVIIVDPKQRAVGAFHAGWRGTVKRIVEKGVGKMRLCFGSRPRDLRAAIGPGIHGCCYTVGEEVRENFESQFAYGAKLFREVKESDPVREKYPLLFLTARAPGHSELPTKIFLDLVEANRRQLMAAGLAAKNIEASPLCTSCHTDLLFSHRAEKGKTGRMMAVVGIGA